ncbi:hypothetical protein [Streptomyces marispadix]|uniref:Secreted protein n=1 Tax=Streptomyces marispadix TaxID=2922868 RepID=A0ABS9SW45_9ACTN|nr:hypothetical protein [Streptomyces marispadix]MCH6160507.1 hypothetical protein [Streptomyces marispadix]
MPRPTPAQLAYGSVTVVCSTLAMLLLTRTPSGPGVALIAVAALALGVLVALTAPGMRTAGRVRMGSAVRTAKPRTATPSRIHARHDGTAAAARARAAQRMAEPSLRS